MAKRGRPVKEPVTKRIEQALGAASTEIVKLPNAVRELAVSQISTDAKTDYEFSRGNLRDLLEKGNEILEGISGLASECESARNYEVAGNVLKVLIEGTRELIALQKDIKSLEKDTITAENDPKSVKIGHADQVTIVENTTSEMLEILEMRKKWREEKELEEHTVTIS